MNQLQKWQEEYTSDKGVPTTTRKTPSSSVVKGFEFLEQNNLLIGNKVLDLGSGPGRNAIYLANKGFEVTAVDFVDSALKELQKWSVKEDVEDNINIVKASIAEELPFKDNNFDVALDVTSSMSLDDNEIKVFEKELRRILKPDGIFIMYVLADKDGYMIKHGDKKKGVYTSPAAGIVERCRSESEIKKIFNNWEILKFILRETEDEYFGKRYKRRLWWGILRNKK